MRTRTLPPYATYLRVYDPMESFGGAERTAWEAYVQAGDRPDRRTLMAREQSAALARAVASPPVAAPDVDSGDAYLLVVDGTSYLCPVEDRLRSWLALSELREGLPEPVVESLLPAAALAQADLDYAMFRADGVPAVPHILTATWHVPIWWFVAFAPEERSLVLEPDNRSLVYRTRMLQARRRVARARRVLRRTVEQGAVTAAVEDFGRWLEEFHPRGFVELDYGGLVHLVGDAALREDRSPADVAEAVHALAGGDPPAAAAAYRRLVDRWGTVQALEGAS